MPKTLFDKIWDAHLVARQADGRTLKDPQMIDQIQWGSMDVNGRVYEESLSDIQDFYVRNKLIARKYTREELGPPDWATALAAKLRPFTLAHDDGQPGCR
jgi:hypothetical protein